MNKTAHKQTGKITQELCAIQTDIKDIVDRMENVIEYTVIEERKLIKIELTTIMDKWKLVNGKDAKNDWDNFWKGKGL